MSYRRGLNPLWYLTPGASASENRRVQTKRCGRCERLKDRDGLEHCDECRGITGLFWDFFFDYRVPKK